jgi:hypothetical protein
MAAGDRITSADKFKGKFDMGYEKRLGVIPAATQIERRECCGPCPWGAPRAGASTAWMVLYNFGVAVILGAACIRSQTVGIALWPAVMLHAMMTKNVGVCIVGSNLARDLNAVGGSALIDYALATM